MVVRSHCERENEPEAGECEVHGRALREKGVLAALVETEANAP
jgi:hypothetical protein